MSIQSRPDVDLKRTIVEELTWTLGVDATTIGVGVTDGAVTLSGEVGSYPEKLRAAKAVQRVSGVHGVAEELTVRSSHGELNDTDIAREVAHALENAVDIAAKSVQATVTDRVVTLTGDVPWAYQRGAAQRAVEHLKGVQDVRNHIAITATISDSTVSRAIEAALVRSARVDARGCRVASTPQGVVTITGMVGSWSERQQVSQVAWAGHGVTAVHNQLRVRV